MFLTWGFNGVYPEYIRIVLFSLFLLPDIPSIQKLWEDRFVWGFGVCLFEFVWKGLQSSGVRYSLNTPKLQKSLEISGDRGSQDVIFGWLVLSFDQLCLLQ